MKQSASKSRMLLLELLLCVFIFSFCVIICAGVFFQGSNVATQSQDLTRAVQVAQMAAESFKATDSLDELAWLLEGTAEQDAVSVHYDANWNAQPAQAGAAYTLLTIVGNDGLPELQVARIRVYRVEDMGALYSLEASKLTPEVTP